MNTVVLVPVMRRPQRVTPFLDSLGSEARALFLVNEEDDTQIAALDRAGADWLSIGPWRPGDYARKINRGYRMTDEELIFLGADDLAFHPGWLDRAISYLSDDIMVVGTNDLGNARVLQGIHSTHSLVTREYVDRFGTIDQPGTVLHEGYFHTFCDDEFIQTAIARRRFAFASDAIVEHLHPHWGKGQWDAVYRMADRSLTQGRALFLRRKRLWDQTIRSATAE